jgi:hypothetical protein
VGIAGSDGAATALSVRGNPNNIPRARGGTTSSLGRMPLFVGKEEVVATLVVVMSLRWWRQERAVKGSERAGGVRRRTQ